MDEGETEPNIIGTLIAQAVISSAEFTTYFLGKMMSDGLIQPDQAQKLLVELSREEERGDKTVIALSAQRILNTLKANDAGYSARTRLRILNGKYRVGLELRKRVGKYRHY